MYNLSSRMKENLIKMGKRYLQLIVLSLFFAIIFHFSFPAFAEIDATLNATTNSFGNLDLFKDIGMKIKDAIPIFLGGLLSGYVLLEIKKKSGSGKRLSYSLEMNTGLVNVEKNVKEKVKVLYEDREVFNLSYILINIENTGNAVIKSEELRLEFTEETEILNFYFEPEPEPEMKVTEISESSLRKCERKCKIGHIERAQKLSIRFLVTSESEIQPPKLHPFNENGDVEFVSIATAKTLSDREKITRFLSLLIIYSNIPISPAFPSALLYLVKLGLFLFILKLIVPFSEVISELIFKLFNPDDKDKPFLSILQDAKVEGEVKIDDINQRIQR